jgi:hypothetical protein
VSVGSNPTPDRNYFVKTLIILVQLLILG